MHEPVCAHMWHPVLHFCRLPQQDKLCVVTESPCARLKATWACLQILRKLRKLSWAENERYLVRTLLKAVKGRFSQVPQVASLAAGLARYHPSLGVAFVDALLEEVRASFLPLTLTIFDCSATCMQR